MNLADPELEFIDPTPNVHSMFIHFDDLFFSTKLAGKAVVRWSKRMYSCAGVCSYEGRGGICDIALSEPLLKLRPRKDLVQTLLHEMIHAYLFVVGRDQSRNGHGPNFLAHMHRINAAAGLNISVYHDFHNEVDLYMTHVWRCNGPCQKNRPYFGVVRRAMNKAPGPSDCWWTTHKRICGGTFNKISEPEEVQKPTKQPKNVPTKQPTKTKTPIADITKYINNNNGTIKNKNNNVDKENPNMAIKTPVFTGSGQLGGQQRTSLNVADTVRNVWANKTLTTYNNSKKDSKIPASQGKSNKRLSNIPLSQTPPKKIKKIDDYFKASASSILKDVYGTDFTLTQSTGSKLKAVANEKLVQCPVCSNKVCDTQINSHIDECLNQDLVEKLSKDTIRSITPVKQSPKIEDRKDIVKVTPFFPPYKPISVNNIKHEPSLNNPIKEELTPIKTEPRLSNFIDLTTVNTIKVEPSTSSDCIDLTIIPVKELPGTSEVKQICPCCGIKIDKSVQEHLDECLSFFNNNTTIPEEGMSMDKTVVIDDSDDEFDETQTMNETGTKSPCPCCMRMIEVAAMNEHLDVCLALKTEGDRRLKTGCEVQSCEL